MCRSTARIWKTNLAFLIKDLGKLSRQTNRIQLFCVCCLCYTPFWNGWIFNEGYANFSRYERERGNRCDLVQRPPVHPGLPGRVRLLPLQTSQIVLSKSCVLQKEREQRCRQRGRRRRRRRWREQRQESVEASTQAKKCRLVAAGRTRHTVCLRPCGVCEWLGEQAHKVF